MAKAKYKKYYELMMEQNRELFDEFRPIHDKYKQNRQQYQQELNEKGKRVVDTIRNWERKLCRAMGKSKYSKYAEKLSEKFWNLVRDDFDQIDMVGLKIEK